MSDTPEETKVEAPPAVPEELKVAAPAKAPVHERRSEGRICAATGPVVDVKFPSADDLPPIDSAIFAESFTGRKIIFWGRIFL